MRKTERNMLVLNAFSSELDMTLKLAFPRYMLVSSAIQFVIKRFFIVFGDKSVHAMPSLEELAQFSMFHLREQAEPVPLQRDYPLSACGLRDEVT